MSDLKTLRKRIKSVKSTQKITKAMKVVSAAKLRKVRMKAEAAAPYARLMRGVLERLASGMESASVPALMSGNGCGDKVLLIVVSSDRGLCGSFNSHVGKKLKEEMAAAKAAGKQCSLIFVGRKAYAPYGKDASVKIVRTEFGLSSKKEIPYRFAEQLAEDVIARFSAGEFGECRVISTEFVNALVQRPVVKTLIPLPAADASPTETDAQATYEYEPGQEEILHAILPKNIATQLYHAVLESAASEHAARMTAMDNASRNAKDMVSRITLRYNRSRQASITKELIEVISGAEAV
jgi:F-type H+-transporting ATPase subunit gamma